MYGESLVYGHSAIRPRRTKFVVVARPKASQPVQIYSLESVNLTAELNHVHILIKTIGGISDGKPQRGL